MNDLKTKVEGLSNQFFDKNEAIAAKGSVFIDISNLINLSFKIPPLTPSTPRISTPFSFVFPTFSLQ